MSQKEVHDAVKECFRSAGERRARQGEHCYFGDPLTDADAARHWVLRFDNDSMTIGGMTLPMHSNVVACEEHDKLLADLYGE